MVRIKEQGTRIIGEGLEAALTKGIGVLEPGCGAGTHMWRVAKQFQNSCFTAFEIDVEIIEQNKEQAKRRGINNISFVTADFCAMPQEWDGRFDYVMIFDCMHDLPHPAKAMAGLKRVLKNDVVVTMLDIDASADMCKQAKEPSTTYLCTIACRLVSRTEEWEYRVLLGRGTCY